jgi:hypothetical protein
MIPTNLKVLSFPLFTQYYILDSPPWLITYIFIWKFNIIASLKTQLYQHGDHVLLGKNPWTKILKKMNKPNELAIIWRDLWSAK